ncbi:MAG: glycosyltransferase family 39 protein [Sandaracinaceae bacterium]|nr:glycosyltransferase family 39 protein [Sandaracinaceae bacterium]
MDDPVHLAIAEHILRDPLHPMRAEVFWGAAPAPAHELNQPHLLFYVFAGLLALGASIGGLQLLISALSLLALTATYRLVRDATGRAGDGLFAAAALGLGPALAPSQNLMTDVPLLALSTVALAALAASPTDRRGPSGALLGASALALACLVKYTALVLLPILAWWLWRHRREARCALAIPLAALVAWSLFNLWDYGDVHLLGRRIAVREDAPDALSIVGLTVGRAALWVLTLGAIAPLSLAFAHRAAARFGGRRLLVGAALGLPLLTAGGQLVAAIGPEVLRGEPLALSFSRGLFFLNGALVLALAASAARRGWATPSTRLFAGWALATALFVVVLSPFVAVRHVLLVLPPLLALLLADPDEPPRAPAAIAALALSLALGLGVGVADHRLAGAYRALPERLEGELAPADRVLYVGHWGFQHYAAEAGWEPYVPGRTALGRGDVLVRPRNVDQPSFTPADAARLRLRRAVVLDATPLELLRTMTSRLGYYSVWHGLPFTPTLEPLDHVELYDVVEATVSSTSPPRR